MEAPWTIGDFCGQSFSVNPRGQIEAIASRDKDGLVVHDMDFDQVREVRVHPRPKAETYGVLTELG